MRHRQIRAVELQHEPGTDNRVVFLLHRIGDRFDIGLVRRIIRIVLEHWHETGRGCGHKAFGYLDLSQRGAQILDVLAQRLAVAP